MYFPFSITQFEVNKESTISSSSSTDVVPSTGMDIDCVEQEDGNVQFRLLMKRLMTWN